MDKDKQIIQLIDAYWKFDEQQQPLSSWHDKQDLLKEVEASLKSQSKSETKTNFYQVRDLTDEEWLKLPKEEILQLYKNCYSQLMALVKSQSEPDKTDLALRITRFISNECKDAPHDIGLQIMNIIYPGYLSPLQDRTTQSETEAELREGGKKDE